MDWYRITRWDNPAHCDSYGFIPRFQCRSKGLEVNPKRTQQATTTPSTYPLGKHRTNALPLDIHFLISRHWNGCPEHLFDYLGEVGINPTVYPQVYRHWLELARWRKSVTYRSLQFIQRRTWNSVTVQLHANGCRKATGCGCQDEAWDGK